MASKIERLKNQNRNLKERAEEKIRRASSTMHSGAGALTAAVVDAKVPTVMGIPVNAVLALGLLGAGLAEWPGEDSSEALLNVGNTIGGIELYKLTLPLLQ